MILRAILLFCLVNFLTMSIAEKMHFEGVLLARLQNLPHRSLGILHWCTIMQPHRADYIKDYLIYYIMYQDEEMFLEGSRKPVVNMMAVRVARQFPNNKELQTVRNAVMHNHFARIQNETKRD